MKTEKILLMLALSAILLTFVFTFPYCNIGMGGGEPDNVPDPLFSPTVTTSAIVNISNIYATGGGNVTSGGSSSVTVRGVCWNIAPEPTTSNSLTNDGTGIGIFTSSIQVLSPNTKYYIRAYATNEQGTSYGDQLSFTTAATGNTPTVITSPVSNISDSAAYCGGNVISPGSSPVIEFGVCWSTIRPDISDPHTVDGTGIGSFTSYIHGLSANTTYYVRAYATNSEETGYGNEISFNTNGGGSDGNPCPGLPTITDPRDGQVYPTVQIGNQCWLLKNMNYQPDSAWCWENNNSNCNTYGRLYNWESALVACPPGWHLPSGNEWGTLFAHLGNDAGGKMKETGTEHWMAPNTGATNLSGFSALPGGFREIGGAFYSLHARAHFWSSSEYEESSPHAYYVKLVEYNANTYYYWNYKTYGNSVRCLKD